MFFGFLAFNGGSQAAIASAGDADIVALAIVNTVIGGELSVFFFFFCACSFRTTFLLAILRPRMSTGSVCVELHCGTVLGDEF